jgi:hypothetical protein
MRLRVLRDALADGEHSGESTPFDFDAFLARKRASIPRDSMQTHRPQHPEFRDGYPWGNT